jgi:hypothetical protein
MEQPTHPYYPIGVLIPNFIPNDRPLIHSLPAFGALIGAVIVSALLLTSNRSHVRPIDRFAASWFALCKWPRSDLIPINKAEFLAMLIPSQAAFYMLLLKVCNSSGHHINIPYATLLYTYILKRNII